MHTSRVLAAALVTGSLLAIAPASEAAGPCARPTITGTSGDDTLRGTEGPDVISGGGGDDTLTGLGGDDILCGGRGQDVLSGGEGLDTLDGGADAKVAEDTDYYVYYGDTLDGGPGDDTLVPGADPRHPGSVDEITYADGTRAVIADLRVGTVISGTQSDRETDTIDGVVSTFTGTAYADTIRGSEASENLYGGAGADYVNGYGGDDWLDAADKYHEHPDRLYNIVVGGTGADTVNGSAGNDLLRGGPGNDLIQAGRGYDLSYGGPGNDGINDDVEPGDDYPQHVGAGGGKHDYLADLSFYDDHHRYQRHVVGRIDMAAGTLRATFGDTVVRIEMPSFEDVASPRGDRWTIFGTNGPDEISAGFLSDPVRIYALGGRDRVFGSDEDDVIDGGKGRDTGTGWGGHDRVISVERIFRD